MRKLSIILTIAFCVQFIAGGCDSPSGSKPEVVAKPTLVAPNDNDSDVTTVPLFKWNGSADKLEVAASPNFSTLIHTANISGQQYQMPGGVLQTGTWYYWHVGKTSGQNIDWSAAIFHFKTQ